MLSKTLTRFAAIAVAALLSVPAASMAEPDAKVLSQKLDNLLRSKSSKGEVTMNVVTPNYKRSLTMEMVTRGLDDTLIRISEPLKERGISTLKKGAEMWNYLPKVKKTIRVPPSMMMGAWMGSDFTNDDLAKGSSWEKDYSFEYSKECGGEGELCLRYTPKPSAAVTWSRVEVLFDAATEMPKALDYYDDKGRKARTMAYLEVKDMGGKKIPTIIKLTPHLKQGHETSITYNKIEFDVDLPDNTFSMTALRRGN